MKYLLLGVLGAIVLYEILAQVANRASRSGDIHEDARLNRMRLLNQLGDRGY
jgi:hypothetical protein